jgi:hypothetical protein
VPAQAEQALHSLREPDRRSTFCIIDGFENASGSETGLTGTRIAGSAQPSHCKGGIEVVSSSRARACWSKSNSNAVGALRNVIKQNKRGLFQKLARAVVPKGRIEHALGGTSERCR